MKGMTTKEHPAVYSGMPSPTGYPPADLTGKLLADWVRSTDFRLDCTAAKLAGTYLDAASGAWVVTKDRKLARRAGELALRDHEKALRRGDDSERPQFSSYGSIHGEGCDPGALQALLKRIGWKGEFPPPPPPRAACDTSPV
jgi:hypothetical protein